MSSFSDRYAAMESVSMCIWMVCTSQIVQAVPTLRRQEPPTAITTECESSSEASKWTTVGLGMLVLALIALWYTQMLVVLVTLDGVRDNVYLWVFLLLRAYICVYLTNFNAVTYFNSVSQHQALRRYRNQP